MRQGYLTIPKELEDAGRADGASEWRIWWQLIGPFPVLFFQNGPWYYVHVICGYLVQAASVAFLIHALRDTRNLYYQGKTGGRNCVKIYESQTPFRFGPYENAQKLLGQAEFELINSARILPRQ